MEVKLTEPTSCYPYYKYNLWCTCEFPLRRLKPSLHGIILFRRLSFFFELDS